MDSKEIRTMKLLEEFDGKIAEPTIPLAEI